MKAIDRAIDVAGGQAALAKAISVTPQAVHQWSRSLRPLPAERCADIERATGGQVTRADLRPDLWGDEIAEPIAAAGQGA